MYLDPIYPGPNNVRRIIKRDKMRIKKAFGCSLLAACAGVGAQSMTVYGLVDTAVEHITNAGGKGTLTRMPSLAGGSFPSRIGFRGTEDLGSSIRAVFALEQGFAPDTGALNQGGRAFGRQAYAGLASPWGTLTFGRQYTMLFWGVLETDLIGPANFGTGSLDSYLPNARADNALAYRGTFNGFTLGATYSFGRDTVNAGPSPAGTNCAGERSGDSKACQEWSAMIKYDTDNFGGALVYDLLRGGPGAFAGLTSSKLKDQRTLANLYVKFNGFKVAGGLIRRDNDGSATTPRSDLWYGAVSYSLATWTFDGELLRLKFKGSSNAANMGVVRATYNLSKQTAVYAMAGRIINKSGSAISLSAQPGGSPLSGQGQSGFTTGIRHTF